MNETDKTPLSTKGEISGAFLLGITQAFSNLNILPLVGLNIKSEQLNPAEWYPYQVLLDVLKEIENKNLSDTIFFQAGINFLELWYENGQGKTMVYSGVDWLYANQSSGGYNSVVRGGKPDEIGWCYSQIIDIEKGIAVYENVMPMPAAFVKGLFYKGCALFNDMDYFEVEGTSEIYNPNPIFKRVMITVRFHLKSNIDHEQLQKKISKWQETPELLSKEEIDSLVWQYKSLNIKNLHETEYNRTIIEILTESIKIHQKYEKELQDLNKDLEAFSYSVSHDLRTPLRAITGYSKILEEDCASKLEPDEMNSLNAIIKNSNKMGELIDDLLAFSRLGRAEIVTSEINMTALVQFIIEEEITLNSNEIEFSISEILPSKGSETLIKQVWANLISNAIKYSKNILKAHIEIGSFHKDNFVAYYVKDNGAGFDMQYYDKLFGVFQRLHSQEEFEGTGIGLAIVQKIVQRHNGTVWAESKVNEGACFYFSLPVIK